MNNDTISDDTSTPSLPDVLRTVVEYFLVDTRVGLPGRVLEYDAATRTALVQPMVGRMLEKQDGTEVEEPLPAIPGVPVEFPGAGRWNVTWPLAEGDIGVLHFHDSSLDDWKSTANRDVIAKDVRMHALADATFRPGLRSPTGPGVTPRTDAMVMGILNGMSIHITETGISLGEASPNYAVALAEKVMADLNTLRDAITNAVPIAQDGGVGLQATILEGLIGWPSTDIGSTSVKVKG